MTTSIPVNIIESLRRYADNHIKPGSFVLACLQNDLQMAIRRADEASLAALPDLVNYLVNRLPYNCWGSREQVEDWLSCRKQRPWPYDLSPSAIFARSRGVSHE